MSKDDKTEEYAMELLKAAITRDGFPETRLGQESMTTDAIQLANNFLIKMNHFKDEGWPD